jgi:DNA-binding NtrC family response regulator
MTITIEQSAATGLVPNYVTGIFQTPPPKPTFIAFPQPPKIAVDAEVAITLDRVLKFKPVNRLLEQATRGALLYALQRTRGNKVAAARILGISRATMRTWCHRYEIDCTQFAVNHASKKEV